MARFLLNYETRIPSTGFPMSLHIRPQDRIHPRLVTAALGLEPLQYVFVEPQRNRLLPVRHHEFGTFPEFRIRKLSVRVRPRGGFDLLVRHRSDPRPVGLASLNARAGTHDSTSPSFIPVALRAEIIRRLSTRTV